MADDELYYLQPDFELSSLTIPKLRSILVSHDVIYPSSAKKQELISIIESEVLPRAKKLLAAQARIRRTSKGIENVASSQELDTELMPPPPQPKTPRSRKSRSTLPEEEDAAPSARKARPSSVKRSIRKPRESDTETDERPRQSVKKAKKSSTGIKPEETPSSRRSLTVEESPFTDDNPFQSGSSPPSAPRPAPTSRKSASRKSLDPKNSPVIVKSEKFELPVSHIGVDTAGVETTEEFTAEEGRELQHALATNKQLARSRQPRKQSSTSTTVKSIPFALLAVVVSAISFWYRQEKISIGYCGVGQPNWSLIQNPNIPSWAHENLQPRCETCPPHAICYPEMQVKCKDDFVLRSHPLSLYGLIPLPPTCEADGEKERRIKAVAERSLEELRKRRAIYECGEKMPDQIPGTTSDARLTSSPKPEISEEELKHEISKIRRKGMSVEEFDDLWRGAIGDIMSQDEVEVIREGSKILLSSTSLANLPFFCAIRRSFVRTLSQYRLFIAALVVAITLTGYGRHRLITYNQAKAQTPQLVAMTLDRLATQAALKEDGRVQEAFLSIGQLRDDVLRNVFSVREREQVWDRVRKIVEGNSNIRAATREGGKTGEWSRVWEWIGPVNLAPGLEGRRSGLLATPENPGHETRNWDEGRPIY